jgi:hypothetical protein
VHKNKYTRLGRREKERTREDGGREEAGEGGKELLELAVPGIDDDEDGRETARDPPCVSVRSSEVWPWHALERSSVKEVK